MTLRCVLILAIIFAAATAWSAESPVRGNREWEFSRRKVQVKRIKDVAGIDSGLVIAYGHPLLKPYRFEYQDNVLFVNGLQVEPSIVLQREYDEGHKEKTTQKAADAYAQLNDLRKSLRLHYSDRTGKVPEEKLRAEILETARAHPLIADAKWMNEKVLVYTRKDDRYPFSNAIGFSPRSPRAHKKSDKTTDELHRQRIERLESHLKTGGCLFFGTIGAWHGQNSQCKSMKEDISTIMTDTALPSDEKERRLRKIFGGSHDEPLDTMANFDSEEWK